MQTRLGIVVALVCAIGGVSVSETAIATGVESRVLRGKVSQVVDGDTIKLKQVGASGYSKLYKIRMVAIDTPETHFQDRSGRMRSQGRWGDEATEYLMRLAPVGATVDVEWDSLDKYNRYLGTVHANGRDVNLTMVRAGWAAPYIICEGPRCDESFFEREHVREYLQACDLARQEGRGIHDPRSPLPELPFEFRLRLSGRRPDKWVGDFSSKQLHRPQDYRDVDMCRRIFFMSEEDAWRAGYR